MRTLLFASIRNRITKFGRVLPAIALATAISAFFPSSPIRARPIYAERTGLPCGQCHIDPSGGGPRTAFGRAFAANGHRLPGVGWKPHYHYRHHGRRTDYGSGRMEEYSPGMMRGYGYGPGMMGRYGYGRGMMDGYGDGHGMMY